MTATLTASLRPRRELVLLGVGHTNAHVLRMWGGRGTPPETRLTCVSNFSTASYSGMLPGVMAGQYPPERMTIDLVRFCASRGVRLILDPVTELDATRRELRFDDRPPLPFDLLSIGIGSVPKPPERIESDAALVPIKPMQTFGSRLRERIAQITDRLADRPLRVVVVGGGVGGVEITLCLPNQLWRELNGQPFDMTLVHGGERIANGLSDRTAMELRRELTARGVTLRTGTRIETVTETELITDRGEQIPFDVAIWVAGAAPPPLLDRFDLPKDDAGFLRTDHTLRVIDHPTIFAVGDTGTIDNEELPKAGVYAVRAAPTLWSNIRANLTGTGAVREYDPQSGFLKLVNLGDGRARADWKGLTAAGRWVWRWKDHIDGRFMDKYQNYDGMMSDTKSTRSQQTIGDSEREKMRCVGCGGKVPRAVLMRTLDSLDLADQSATDRTASRILLDDAAVVETDGSPQWSVSVDAFTPPIADDYLGGRLAALNALSDLYAMGATPRHALATVTLPFGAAADQEQTLRDVLAGITRELENAEAELIGGHTVAGPVLSIGLTVMGPQPSPVWTKSGLRPGDRLVLTRPLGTGVQLAALMRADLSAERYDRLIEHLMRSNRAAAETVRRFEPHAVTDVTGFGLGGHLGEMLLASGVSAEIVRDRLPRLSGVNDLFASGLRSSLADDNRVTPVPVSEKSPGGEQFDSEIFYDPQTGGGLLIGLAAEVTDEAIASIRAAGDRSVCEIGRVTEPTTDPVLRVI